MKHSLKLLAAAVVLALPVSSFAALSTTLYANGSTATTDSTATFASELMGSTTPTANTITSASSVLTASGKVGFGVSLNQTRYLLFKISNATFPVSTTSNLTFTSAAGAAASTAIAGGAEGDNYIIYQITGTAPTGGSGSGLVAADLFSLALSSLKVVDTNSPVKIKYSMYETAAAAVSGTDSGLLVSSSEIDLARFAPGFKVTSTPNTVYANVASSPKPYILFTTATGISTTSAATLASLSLSASAYNPVGATALTLATYLNSTSKFTLKGGSDLSPFNATLNGAGSALYLDATSANCAATATATGTVPATIATDNTATFTLGAALLTATGANGIDGTTAADVASICATVPATGAATSKAIVPQVFTLGTSGLVTSSLTVADVAGGELKRNGVILRAPLVSDSGPSAASINLVNLAATDTKYNVRCLYKGKAEKAGLQDQPLLAGQTKRLYSGTAGLGCPTYAGTPATAASAVEITVEAAAGTVNAVMARENATTGDIGISDMIGNTNGQ